MSSYETQASAGETGVWSLLLGRPFRGVRHVTMRQVQYTLTRVYHNIIHPRKVRSGVNTNRYNLLIVRPPGKQASKKGRTLVKFRLVPLAPLESVA